MKTAERSRFLINALYFILIAIMVFLFYKYLLRFLLPFIVAFIIGVIVQKPADYLSRKMKIKKRVLAPSLAVAVYLIVGTLLLIALYFLFSGSEDFLRAITKNVSSAADVFSGIFNKYSIFLKNLPDEIRLVLENLPKKIGDSLLNYLSGAASFAASFAAKNIPNLIFSFIITVMASVYFARDIKAVKTFLFSLLPEKTHIKIYKIKNILFANVFKMLKGYAILIMVTFSELLIAFIFAGISSPIAIAILISLVDALPILGVGIVLIPWAVVSILTGKIGFGIYLVSIYLIITVVRNILEPKILSSKLGIPPLLSLLIIFCGIRLFGFFGMILIFISLVIIIDFYKNEPI